MKKRILFIGINMNCGGTEKSFLSLANCLDYDRYDVDLLLARRDGLFAELIPPRINVRVMPKYGEFFFLSNKNAFSNILNTFAKGNPLTAFEVMPYFLKMAIFPSKKREAAIRLWCRLLRKFPDFEGEYDAAVAYWGDRTIFYMIDKVPGAKRKIAWMHFDYNTPPRDDLTYRRYFSECDAIVNVSEAVNSALIGKLPEFAPKCAVIENILSPSLIRRMALEGPSFPDAGFKGKRVLSVIRIAKQKGYDFIPPILAGLRERGRDVRWYILGEGDEANKAELAALALKYGVADSLILLGTTTNPYPYMRDCDVYVQPSRFEGKPITVEEAKIMRCPIVAANYTSASEQLKGGEYGLIADAKPEALLEAVDRLLSAPKLRERLSQTLAACDFGSEGEIEKFYRLIEG